MSKRAHLGRSWLLDGPLPSDLTARLTNTITGLTYQYDPETRDTVSVNVSYQVLEAVRLSDNRWLLPREAVSEKYLRLMGYKISRSSHDRVPIELPQTIQPRDSIQEQAISAAHKGGFIVLNPGRGKTVIMLKLIQTHRTPALVFVDDGAQVTQWKDRALQHLGVSEDEIAILQGPYKGWDWQGKKLGITLFQSFHPALKHGLVPAELFSYFGIVCIDEAHTAYSRTRGAIPGLFPGLRFALTATPEKDGKHKQSFLHVGDVRIEYRKGDLIPHVHGRLFEIKAPAVSPRTNRAYQKAMKIALGGGNKKPNAQYLDHLVRLIEELQEQGRVIMVLVPRVAFLWDLYNRLDDASLIDSKTPFDLRSQRLLASDTVLVSSKIGEKALDRPDLDTLILAFPLGVQALGRLEQATGRILRKKGGKRRPEVFICAPDDPMGKRLLKANLENCAGMGFSTNKTRKKAQKMKKAPRATHGSLF